MMYVPSVLMIMMKETNLEFFPVLTVGHFFMLFTPFMCINLAMDR